VVSASPRLSVTVTSRVPPNLFGLVIVIVPDTLALLSLYVFCVTVTL
jgi:hypothetical protein